MQPRSNNNDKISKDNSHHLTWPIPTLSACVLAGDVKGVNAVIRQCPTAVIDHPYSSNLCATAFQMHNLPILEALLKAGADLAAPADSEGRNLINYGFNLFLHKGKVWPFPKNWYRRCMKRILTLRPTDREDKAGYNFVLECTLKALCEPQPLAPGLDELLLRLLQAGADPNAGKDYFYMLLDNPKPEIITLLRRYGADFNSAPLLHRASTLRFNTLVDYAHHLMTQETSSAKKRLLTQCKGALEAQVYSGAALYDMIMRQGRLGYLEDEMIDNKECIFAFILRLPTLDEKIRALEEMIKGQDINLLSRIMWAQRGFSTPDLTNGIRALAVAALAEAKQQQTMLHLPAQAKDDVSSLSIVSLDDEIEEAEKSLRELEKLQVLQEGVQQRIDEIIRSQIIPVAATSLSTTAGLYPRIGVPPQPLPSVEPVPAAVTAPPLSPAPQPSALEQTLVPVFIATTREPGGEVSTNVFEAQMAEMPVVREYLRNPPPPYVAPKDTEEKRRVALNS